MACFGDQEYSFVRVKTGGKSGRRATRSPELETRNSKLATRNWQLATSDLELFRRRRQPATRSAGIRLPVVVLQRSGKLETLNLELAFLDALRGTEV
jgi:hypothetical protein